jgi:hypothetical protein
MSGLTRAMNAIRQPTHTRRRPSFDAHAPLRRPGALFSRPAAASSRPAPAHDFLVPNPRPDLCADAHTLRMIEAG